MTTPLSPAEPTIDLDAGVVDDLVDCVAGAEPKSFFLFAGAGSGKTYTLVSLLRRLTGAVEADKRGAAFGERLRAAGQTIAVITYTRNAADEVRARLGDDPLVLVSTIHSFLWRLIQPHQQDVRDQLIKLAEAGIEEAQEKLDQKREGLANSASKAKKPPKPDAVSEDSPDTDPAAVEEHDLAKARRKFQRVVQATRYTYTPEAGRPEVGALTHAEVLKIGCALLEHSPMLGGLLAATHPLVLIDESQDTNKDVLARLLAVGAACGLRLGLIGDHRQRIYMDGEPNIVACIPRHWARPRLQYNRRCPQRIVSLINRIWHAEVEGRRTTPVNENQHPLPLAAEGAVRVYIGRADEADKPAAERRCAEGLASELADDGWAVHTAPGAPGGYQLLTITHQLGAERGGFGALYKPVDTLRGDGARSDVAEDPEPLRRLFQLNQCREDDFAVMSLLREVCPELQRMAPAVGAPATAREALAPIQSAVDELRRAWDNTAQPPTIGMLLECVHRGGLFALDEFEEVIASGARLAVVDADSAEVPVTRRDEEKKRQAAAALCSRPWSEYIEWRDYLEGQASYATHQGVKGSEFDRVMVLIDDHAAKYNLFSFEKLFGSMALSRDDRTKHQAGGEITIDRTLRLLYVTCSRAKKSLALVVWTKDPAKVRATLLRRGWFEAHELLEIPSA